MSSEQTKIVLDLETTNNGPDGSPDPVYPENKILLVGWKELKRAAPAVFVTLDPEIFIKRLKIIIAGYDLGTQKIPTPIILIGHNLKFDLGYLMRDYPDFPWHYCEIRDTMIGSYLYSGHANKFISLEEAYKQHTGRTYKKRLDLDSLLAKGVKMTDIPISELEEYLIDDVEYTHGLYLDLYSKDKTLFENMSYILPITEMELNGLIMDQDKLKILHREGFKRIEEAKSKLFKYYQGIFHYKNKVDLIKEEDINLFSNKTISYLLTGYPEHGINQTVKSRHIVLRPGLEPLLNYFKIEPKDIWGYEEPTNKALGFPINEKIIKILQNRFKGHVLVDCLIAYKEWAKIVDTYTGPFLAKLKTKDTIHPSINLCSTNTGRTSSSSPNGQNMPPLIRECVKAEGEFLYLDFKQLEMVAAATLSKDPQLIDDLNSGVDLHFETGKDVMGWTSPSEMTEESRRLVKAINFGLLYGGGAPKLANDSGADITLVKDLINSFYYRYPQVRQWQEEFYENVVNFMVPDCLRDGEQCYKSMITLPPDHGHRRFFFTEKESPTWLKKRTGRKYSFKPTETKNYPVQGFAGGDIVLNFIYIVWVLLRNKGATLNDIKFRLTVHDSLLIDILNKDFIKPATDIIEYTCTFIGMYYKVPVPIVCEPELLTHWK